MSTILDRCEVPTRDRQAWIDLLHRIRSGDHRAPTKAVRVQDANSRHLGVHAAIHVADDAGDGQPAYVERDFDQGPHGLYRVVETGARSGAFVVLVGRSSTGKTRSAFEAVRAKLPGWWLVHPDRAADVTAFAQHPVAQSVLWLDDLRRYISSDPPLDDGTIREILRSPAPVLIIGGLWPQQFHEYTSLQELQPEGAANARALLDLADVIMVDARFSAPELERAKRMARSDPRIRAALASDEYGVTQTLAAGPQLLERWHNADAYARAVLTAAIDLTRLGVLHPIPPRCLEAAAPEYCRPFERSAAKATWFNDALGYLTEIRHGAAAALRPEATGMGRIDGYTVADFLVQHVGGLRSQEPMPESAWRAAIEHVHDADDLGRLARTAERTLRYRHAIDLYRRIEHPSDAEALSRATLLAYRGDFDELKSLADGGDVQPRWRLIDLLAEHDRLPELKSRADDGDEAAAQRLAALLAQRQDVEALTSRALAGDWAAASRLAEYFADAGDLDRAIMVMQTFTSLHADHVQAAVRLAELLGDRGDLEWAIEILEELPEAEAGGRLADLLIRNHEYELAIEVLAELADDGDWSASWRLADVLAQQDDLEKLRARAEADDDDATWRLVDVLVAKERVTEAEQLLRERAEAGNAAAALRLAELLERHVEDPKSAEDELRTRIGDGDRTAIGRLAGLLVRTGRRPAAEELWREWADRGDQPSAWQLATALAERGAVDELTRRADEGDQSMSWHLAEFLARRGQARGLVGRINAGDQHAGDLLPVVLNKAGRYEEALRVRRLGLDADGSIARQ